MTRTRDEGGAISGAHNDGRSITGTLTDQTANVAVGRPEAVRLWVVGVGPGDPELVTVKAARLIGEADLVCYPRPRRTTDESSTADAVTQRLCAADSSAGDAATPRLHARDIAAPFRREGQREFAFALPMSADPRIAEPAYAAAAARIDAELAAGGRVVVLAEGDPLFFGSAGRLIEVLGARWPVAFVPGIASPNAAAARLGRALTQRDDVYKVLSATLPEDRLSAELAAADAAAILKIGRHFDRVRAVCDRLGLTGRAHFIANATRADEMILPLAAVAAGAKPYFSLILIPRAASGSLAADADGGPAAAAVETSTATATAMAMATAE